MTRTVPAWVGKTNDAKIPPRVRLRVIDRQGGKCGTCNRKLGMCGEAIEIDHVVALINGGQHHEANLQALCGMCHAAKTRQDVATKAKTASVRKKHLGQKETTSPLPGGRKSKWKRKIGGGVVMRGEE